MPQQHNPGRHVQSLTLPQSRHNHRNTSAYIFPTVPTPRTTPPTPGTASPRRRAPTLQLPDATLPPHSRHTPAAAHRLHTVPTPRTTPPTPGHASPPGTAPPLRRAPTLQLPVATLPPHSRHTPAAARRSPPPRRLGQSRRHRNPPRAGHCLTSPPGPNAPTPRRNAPAPFKTHPCRRTTAPHRPNPRTTPPAQDSTAPPGTKKSGSASRTYSFVSNFSVKNRRLHLAQTNALTQHNQSGAYPLINPCPHN